MSEIAGVNVSRETLERLRDFVALVEKWNPKINLVSKSTIPDIWQRHIVDSVQIFNLAPTQGLWVDMGSGGGFPGIVIGILSAGMQINHQLRLIESDIRKCVFLRTCIRELNLNATVISDRVEAINPLEADIVSARALSDLSKLLGFANMHLKSDGVALFPKGETWEKENSDAKRIWSYHHEAIRSATNPSAAILKIKDIARV